MERVSVLSASSTPDSLMPTGPMPDSLRSFADRSEPLTEPEFRELTYSLAQVVYQRIVISQASTARNVLQLRALAQGEISRTPGFGAVEAIPEESERYRYDSLPQLEAYQPAFRTQALAAPSAPPGTPGLARELKLRSFPKFSRMPTTLDIEDTLAIATRELAEQEDRMLWTLIRDCCPAVPASWSDLPGLAARMREEGHTPALLVVPRKRMSELVTQAPALHIEAVTERSRILLGEVGVFERDALQNVSVRVSPFEAVAGASIPDDELWLCAEPKDVGSVSQRVDPFVEPFQLEGGTTGLIGEAEEDYAVFEQKVADAGRVIGELFKDDQGQWCKYQARMDYSEGSPKLILGLFRDSPLGLAFCQILAITLTEPKAIVRVQLPSASARHRSRQRRSDGRRPRPSSRRGPWRPTQP